MLERASGQFTIEGNVEDIFGGVSGATRIARISQTCLFTGALQGESIAEYTAVLPRESDGAFQGYQRISGALGEREGTFVVCVTGEYAKGQPRGSWTIVPKSGSGDFAHIRGSGTFSQSPGKAGSYKLEFDLRKPRRARDATAAAEPTERELIPGIDIVAEKEPASEIEPVVAAPLAEIPVGKPARRPRKKAATTEPPGIEPIMAEPEIAPKQSRKKAAPIEVEEMASVEAVAAPVAARKRTRGKPENVSDQASAARQGKDDPPVRKRSRKTVAPEIAVEAPVVAETAPRRRRKQSESPVEQSVAEAKAPPSPAQKRGRKPTTDAAASVTAEPAPKRRRKPAEANVAKTAAVEPVKIAEPKPVRRKTPASPPAEPLPLPVAQNKPARQRKSKAA